MNLIIADKRDHTSARKWLTRRSFDGWPITSRWINAANPERPDPSRDLADLAQATHLLVHLPEISSRLHDATFAAGALCAAGKPVVITTYALPPEQVSRLLGTWTLLPNVTLVNDLEAAATVLELNRHHQPA